MFCDACGEKNPDIHTKCGHSFHANCFQKLWKDCHLPCLICQHTLGSACKDKEEWVVGVNGRDKWCSCYKVSANESKIIRYTDEINKWVRKNGRLHSKNIYPLCFNICVS